MAISIKRATKKEATANAKKMKATAEKLKEQLNERENMEK